MLGARIASLRRQAGLSQAALAKKLNISSSAVGMYEQGRREPQISMLIKLAHELNVSVDYLLTGDMHSGTRDMVSPQVDKNHISIPSINNITMPPMKFSREELIVLIAALLMDETKDWSKLPEMYNQPMP